MAAPHLPIPPALIVSGLKREAALFAGPDPVSACGNAAVLRSKFDELADRPLRTVVSFGVCGGLDPTLRPGDIVLGIEVVLDSESVRADPALTQWLERRLISRGERVVRGKVAAVYAPVMTAEDKSALRAATGAVAVDMESFAAGRFAKARGARFAILRAVSDPAERDLPPLVVAAVDPAGGVNVVALIRGLVGSPTQLTGLIAAALDSAAAFRALRRCSRLHGLFAALVPPHL
jgi:adenosylhomocysteine nucleosidase